MISCGRQSFILLSMGTLMDRDEKGKVVIADTLDTHAAMKAHDKGDWVRLVREGNKFSYIRNGKEVTEEQYLKLKGQK